MGLRVAVGLVLLVAVGCSASTSPSEPAVEPRTVRAPDLVNPSDVIKWNDRWIATRLFSNDLVIADDALFTTDVSSLDGSAIGERFRSPHFLAEGPDGSLLISNGWGSSIVAIDDLNGGGWREFSGVGEPFDAPHGVCATTDGWIYVGDSLNSRIVRFRDMDGTGWSVFEDVDDRVAYSRELHCEGNTVFVANTYEDRPGLNRGSGEIANVLRIDDWDSGVAEAVVTTTAQPIMGVTTDGGGLLVSHHEGVVRYSEGGEGPMRRGEGLGIGYGTFTDPETGNLIVAYYGDLADRGAANHGGLLVLPFAS